jgi:hypothetical protein
MVNADGKGYDGDAESFGDGLLDRGCTVGNDVDSGHRTSKLGSSWLNIN